MKKLVSIASAALAAAFMATSAQATEFFFAGIEGNGGAPIDAPTGNIAFDCGSEGSDLCTDDDALGFDYSKDGVSFNATAFTGGTGLGTDMFMRGEAAILIQDLVGPNQGLGVISEAEFVNGSPVNTSEDQINFDTGESILITFAGEVTLDQIAVNSGTNDDCPGIGGLEGPCGVIGIIIDGVLSTFDEFVAGGIIASGGSAVQLVGTTFEFIGLTSGAGYSIESFQVVPVPGAIPLLLSGVAGLGFAARRRKAA
ncbi:MAG: VPLPA-CTERM sorting domain-containing protein [Pseudomonadota bacterium]